VHEESKNKKQSHTESVCFKMKADECILRGYLTKYDVQFFLVEYYISVNVKIDDTL
jgi:hypothetical protein